MRALRQQTRATLSAALLLIVAAQFTGCATTRTERSPQARAEFARMTLCPATGKPRGACHGYVVDHVKPLCAGGADHHTNMQWQTVAAAKVKDREERRLCAIGKL